MTNPSRPTEPDTSPQAKHALWMLRMATGDSPVAASLAGAEPAVPLFVSPKQIAARWACSSRHVRDLIARGELRGRRYGTIVRVALADLEVYEARAVIAATNNPLKQGKLVSAPAVPLIGRKPKPFSTAFNAPTLAELRQSWKPSASISRGSKSKAGPWALRSPQSASQRPSKEGV
jgi:excisionase family DNA binding protein